MEYGTLLRRDTSRHNIAFCLKLYSRFHCPPLPLPWFIWPTTVLSVLSFFFTNTHLCFLLPNSNPGSLPDKYRMPSQVWISNKQVIFWLKYVQSIAWDVIMLITHIYLKFKFNLRPCIFISLIRKLVLEPFVVSIHSLPPPRASLI